MKNWILFLGLFFNSILLFGQLHYTNRELPCLNKTFNVHVHVVLDSFGNSNVTEAEIRSKVAAVSEKFAPICMDFKVCEIDYIVNYNFDSIPRFIEYFELHTKYSINRRINIFISSQLFIKLNDIYIPVGGLEAGSIFVTPSSLGAIAHELGHFFGLSHTFEGSGSENVDGSNCLTEGDRLCDTPADPYIIFDDLSKYINTDCEFIGLMKDRNGEYYSPHTANIMSYYGCPCDEFTNDQFLLMVKTYNTYYKNLW